MKYILWRDDDKGNTFDKEFETLEEGLKELDWHYDKLSDFDKKHTVNCYLLESINPDEEAENHFDGNFVKVKKLNGVEK